jgi:hypothetical protein
MLLLLSLIWFSPASLLGQGSEFQMWESPLSRSRIALPIELVKDEVTRSLETRHPQVLLALRSKIEHQGKYYPTLTITSHQQSLPTLNDFGSKILNDYHTLGISDAALDRESLVDSFGNGYTLPAVEVSYSRNKEKFIATVVGIPTGDTHELITFTDTPTTFIKSRAIRATLLSSIFPPSDKLEEELTLDDEQPRSRLKSLPTSTFESLPRDKLMLLGLGLLLPVGFSIWRRLRR